MNLHEDDVMLDLLADYSSLPPAYDNLQPFEAIVILPALVTVDIHFTFLPFGPFVVHIAPDAAAAASANYYWLLHSWKLRLYLLIWRYIVLLTVFYSLTLSSSSSLSAAAAAMLAKW